MTDPEACEQVNPDSEAIVAAIEEQIGIRKHDLLLLKSIDNVVDKLRDLTDENEHGRVKFAAEQALIAVAERLGRIFRRDLPVESN
jgi:hypothetical protein